jgi:16S rRNA (guanine527-N7)-methyltransferase
LENILPVELPGVSDERFLVVVKKVAATPPQYPRHAGLPVKKPL